MVCLISMGKIVLITLGVVVVIFAVIAASKTAQKFQQETSRTEPAGGSDTQRVNVPASAVSWEFDGSQWQASGQPPPCDEPLKLTPPTDLKLATSLLYPGQYRGGDYKAHGGFRFDGQSNNITVKIPLDAKLTNGSRYLEDGEVQYLFTFISDCGIAYRFDHLLTLSPKFAEIANKFPKAVPDDSRTTPINPGVSVTVGEVVATAVGFTKTNNVTFDFGVYDLRQRNQISKDPSWAKKPELANSQAPYAICWFDLFPPEDSARIKSLPATGVEGKTSDYCKP